MITTTLNYPALLEKWKPVLEHKDVAPIRDRHRKAVTAALLEEQQKSNKLMVTEAGEPTNVTGGVQKWDPILISLVRRMAPNLIAYDICGGEPLTGSSGLIFALRARYTDQNGTEALFNEADTDHS